METKTIRDTLAFDKAFMDDFNALRLLGRQRLLEMLVQAECTKRGWGSVSPSQLTRVARELNQGPIHQPPPSACPPSPPWQRMPSACPPSPPWQRMPAPTLEPLPEPLPFIPNQIHHSPAAAGITPKKEAKVPFIEKKTFVNGVESKNYSNDQLLALIAGKQAELKKYKDLGDKIPSRLKKHVAQIEKDLQDLNDTLDAEDAAKAKAKDAGDDTASA